jgi:membrane protease YdiL (CAAX protease family)
MPPADVPGCGLFAPGDAGSGLPQALIPNRGINTAWRVSFKNARRLSVEFNLPLIDVSSQKTHYALRKTGGASHTLAVFVCRHDEVMGMNNGLASNASRPWRFLAAAVGSSWTLWWLAIAVGRRMGHSFSSAMLVGGLFCVAASAVYYIYRARDSAVSHEFWSRLFDVRRLSLKGAMVAIFLLPAIACAVAALDGFRTGHMPDFALAHGPSTGPLDLIKALGIGLVVGPFLEEMGWRGYALKPLQMRYGALGGALTLACVHAAWHLPLFYFAGTYQQKLGVLTLGFWRFMITVAAFDIIAAALFNVMGDSALAAILFHFSFNLAGGLFDLSPVGAWSRDAVTVALAIAVILCTRSRLFVKPTE